MGAGFQPDSASGEIVAAVRERRLRMPWSEATRAEVERILRRIPPLSWSAVEPLFRDEERVRAAGAGESGPDGSPANDREDAAASGADLDGRGLSWIPDPADRKFGALARHTGATLISSDRHFLDGRSRASFPILTPGEYRRRHLGGR